MSQRSFLFLQGIASPFFRHLAGALKAARCRVQHVNFCGGDRLFAPAGPGWDFGDEAVALPEFLAGRLHEDGVTDVVMFGDCRPVHLAAMPVLRAAGVRVWVFEEGYLRPGWVTLEEGGVNGHSRLPKDPAGFRARCRGGQVAEGKGGGYSMAVRGVYDILYHLARWGWFWRYPGYRHHRSDWVVQEYLGWLKRAVAGPWKRRHARAVERRVRGASGPCFLLPLQLDSDSQLQVHSPFHSIPEAIQVVVASFAANAPEGATLIIKRHPLDPATTSYGRHIERLVTRHGLHGRVEYIDGGNLEALIEGCAGVVTINSTVGLTTLSRGRALKVLGAAVYDVPGLSFQGRLDRFWAGPEPPDGALLACFLDVLRRETQLAGDFYSRAGIERVVAGAMARFEAAGGGFPARVGSPERG